jgi:8-amino-7-oxononanoate synthase
MMDATLSSELDRLTESGLRRTLAAVDPTLRDFASNDYLALARDPRLARAATDALADGPFGAGAARLISGTHPLHLELEAALASYKRTEAALLFGSGYLANIGAIPALVGPRDAIYADRLNHASLIDGCRLSRAEVRTFAHNDIAALADMLDADRGSFRRRLIVVDSVFSMDGDLAPLCEIVPLARTYDAWTYVDDAHGTGVLGREGRGAASHWGVEGQIDVLMGTLGKALGTSGAFVAGSRTLIDFLINRARSFIFTTATPPALAAATLEALRIAEAEPERRTRVRDAARRLRSGLAALGYTLEGPSDSHIIPVPIGDADRTMQVGASLRARGFLVGAVRPPTVPAGTSRLRLTVNAAHTPDEVEALLVTLAEVSR